MESADEGCRIGMIRPHVIEGSLVVIGGVIPGLVLDRIDKYYYNVLTEGAVQSVHRDDFVVLRYGYEDDENEEE